MDCEQHNSVEGWGEHDCEPYSSSDASSGDVGDLVP